MTAPARAPDGAAMTLENALSDISSIAAILRAVSIEDGLSGGAADYLGNRLKELQEKAYGAFCALSWQPSPSCASAGPQGGDGIG